MCASPATTTTIQASDARGRNIILGDTVIYPTRRGSSLTMTEGEVVGIINPNSVQVRREREATNFGGGFEFLPTSRTVVTVGTQQLVRL